MRFKPGISVFARQQHAYLAPAAAAGSICAPAVNRTKMFVARDLESKGAAVRKGTSPQSLTAIASLIDAARERRGQQRR